MKKLLKDKTMWIIAMAIVIVVSLFGGFGDQEAAEPPSPSPAELEASALRDQIKEHLRANFAQTTWYPYIVDLRVELLGDKARMEVETLISDRELADRVCRILWANYIGMTGREELNVSIRGDRGVGAYCGV